MTSPRPGAIRTGGGSLPDTLQIVEVVWGRLPTEKESASVVTVYPPWRATPEGGSTQASKASQGEVRVRQREAETSGA